MHPSFEDSGGSQIGVWFSLIEKVMKKKLMYAFMHEYMTEINCFNQTETMTIISDGVLLRLLMHA